MKQGENVQTTTTGRGGQQILRLGEVSFCFVYIYFWQVDRSKARSYIFSSHDQMS